MTTIRLHDSMTRRKVDFAPIDEKNVRMYVCGPTVYDRAHIGNARPVVVFDVLFRLLRHVYGPDHVTYVRNITDIDDKIMARAAETGRPIDAITAETARWFEEDMAALGCLPPTHQPRATEHVPGMIAMIERLIARGSAYVADGHVLFEVATFPDYGKLSGRSTEDMIAGARVEVAPYKRDPMDFVLWKPSAPDQPGWESPWGRGRPGWHIECSAMSAALLGGEFDIHGGGADLMFPHHENEIAQSRCADPAHGFARHWMHNGMVLVDGRKMSKSLGNFIGLDHAFARFHPRVVRNALTSVHYSKPLDWNEERLSAVEKETFEIAEAFVGFDQIADLPPSHEIIERISDDLNFSAALAHIREQKKRSGVDARIQMRSDARFLGVWDNEKPNDLFVRVHAIADVGSREVPEKLDVLIQKMAMARAARNFQESDRLRTALKEAGIEVQQTPTGVSHRMLPNFDPKKLDAISI